MLTNLYKQLLRFQLARTHKLVKQINLFKVSTLIMAFHLFVLACNEAEISTPTTSLGTPVPTIIIYTPKPIPSLSPTVTPELTVERRIEVDPQHLDGINLDFWHVWAGEPGISMQVLVEEFNQTNEFNIFVQPVYVGNYNDLNEKIQIATLEGGLPNLAVGFNYQILTWGMEEPIVVDLTDYTSDSIWGINATERDDFFSFTWDQDQIGDIRIGLPFQSSTYLMFYNTSWAEELGFDSAPRTPQEFKEQACAASQANHTNPDVKSGTGGWVTNTAPSAIVSWMYAFGSDLVPDLEDSYNLSSPEIEDTFAFLKDLYDSGCAWQTEDQYAESEFADRLALFITAPLSDIPHVFEAMQAAQNEDAWTVIGFPSVESRPVINVYGPSLVMFTSSEAEQLAAWIFMKWLVSPTVQAQWVQASGSFPVRSSSWDYLAEFISENPQWAAAFELLPHARTEPHYPSWSVVRWAISDVGTQTFRYYFTADRIPVMLKLLDETASELHARLR